jgi:predicted ribosome quality control (RQC) complex YloA/Tae2 family protein
MDFLSLKASVLESARKSTGQRVTESFQLSVHEVLLRFGKGPALLLSIHPSKGGIFLLEEEERAHLKTMRSTSNLTELLRARIKGAVLTSMEIPVPGERIVHFYFAPGWPDRTGVPVTVVLEIMGRHSNLLVLENDRILAAFKTVPPDKSRTRPVVPGDLYHSPPPRNGMPRDQLRVDSLPEPGSPVARQQLMDTVSGLSPHTASQALLAAPGKNKEALFDALERMEQESNGETGYILRSRGKSFLTSFQPEKLEEADIIEMYEPFSRAAMAWRGSDSLRSDSLIAGIKDSPDRIAQVLASRIDHISSALKQLVKEKERCQGFSKSRAMAEVLLINASGIETGLSSVTLSDPYGGKELITVPMDPKHTPQENANRLFSKARRLERGLSELESRDKELQNELGRLEAALEALVENGDPEPARKILGDMGEIQHGSGTKVTSVYKGPGRRKVVEGFTILVGRSATDNDKVTFKAAGPRDLWLHARDYPGSHVVIISGKKQVPDNVLYAAAALAAEGSGAKNDTAPEIMVTERKWVKKLKGGKPGQVTVERFKSIRPRIQNPESRSREKKP